MKQKYNIEVDCANCANLMEETAGKVKGVKEVSVKCMALRMTVAFEAGYDPAAVMKDVRKACRKAEPDCDIEL